jgi:prepilin signal peptidase PulO-like enzyme (type II secretory pathway)
MFNFFAWVTNFEYNYLGTLSLFTFIIVFDFIIFLIQIFRHYINLYMFIWAIYLSNIIFLTKYIKKLQQDKFTCEMKLNICVFSIIYQVL